MKNLTYALIALMAVALIGCSSPKTHVRTGTIHAKTFSFINTGSRQMPVGADREKRVHDAIQAAIKQDLAAKGVIEVGHGGDVIVAYLVIVGNNVSTTSLNDYFGYGDDASKLVSKVHSEQTDSGDARYYFEAGSLIIDIIDANNSRLLWRDTVRSDVRRDLPIEEREARVQKLVTKALNDVKFVP